MTGDAHYRVCVSADTVDRAVNTCLALKGVVTDPQTKAALDRRVEYLRANPQCLQDRQIDKLRSGIRKIAVEWPEAL